MTSFAPSRRRFLQAAAASGALSASGVNTAIGRARTAGAHHVPSAPAAGAERSGEWDRKAIEQEIRRRAADCLPQRYLVVDYYRIRRQLAYQLPVRSLSVPSVPVPSIPNYPWATWMLWCLEERVNTLGWAATWFHDERARRAAARDLETLAAWPAYRQYEGPDLSSAHAARILWTACTQWPWVDQPLRNKLHAGCTRHVNELRPAIDRQFGRFHSSQDLLALPEPYQKLHNIPLIGTIGAALTASTVGSPHAAELCAKVQAVFGAVLERRRHGYSEGVGYDGYVLDFIVDWLRALPATERRPVLDHPCLRQFLAESYRLAAPGAAANVAPLSDVEPKEMPFHISAQAKLQHLQPDGTRRWHLARWPLPWMRAACLGALYTAPRGPASRPPKAGAANAQYAVVLRSGWQAKDLAVVASCTRSPASHIQRDNGTLVIGTQQQWLITDPGYQQYIKGIERDFTLGPAAHNTPVINGLAQTRKRPRRETLEDDGHGLCKTVLDLTACYPDRAGVQSVRRTVWLSGRSLVVVADQVDAAMVQSLRYHWHGHPEAAWWCQDGWALLHVPAADLWFTSPQATIAQENIRRLPGSRGQLTLVVDADPGAPTCWWVFLRAAEPARVEVEAGGAAIRVLGRRFRRAASMSAWRARLPSDRVSP